MSGAKFDASKNVPTQSSLLLSQGVSHENMSHENVSPENVLPESSTASSHTTSSHTSTDAKPCPWCGRWALKDDGCNYIFACGLVSDGAFASGAFVIGAGCGRSWCWQCGLKYCGMYIDPATGKRLPSAKDTHDAHCCASEPGFRADLYCPGGHSPHCAPRRW